MEWNNPYNSFNSMKGLTYYDHYKKIVGWLDGKNELPPPIEASLDPMNACNNKCYYCNSQRYLRDNPTKLQKWDKEFLYSLIRRLAIWGVKAFCWGGGGEALLNKNLHGMTELGTQWMECSIITNGVLLDDYIDELLLCRWIGISLDSAHPAVYKQVRGTDDCLTVLNNIKKLVSKRTKTDICIKCLVLPETIDTLYYTCQVAKSLGVQDFHVRPVDLERKDFKTRTQLNLDMDKVKDVFDRCHSLETPEFRVYTVGHKFTETLQNKENDFRCLASPILTQICTDRKMYVCVDHRLEERFEIKEWGSEQHRELIKSINPIIECSRCTFREYNKQVEAVIDDSLCRNFP